MPATSHHHPLSFKRERAYLHRAPDRADKGADGDEAEAELEYFYTPTSPPKHDHFQIFRLRGDEVQVEAGAEQQPHQHQGSH